MASINSKKLCILIVINDLTGGGAELVVTNLCKAINKNKFIVKICVLKEIGYRGQHLKELGFKVIGPIHKNDKNNYLSALILRRIIKSEHIDIVHSHSTAGLIEVGLLKIIMPSLPVLHTFHFGNYPHMALKYIAAELFFSKFFTVLIAVGLNQRIKVIRCLKIRRTKIFTVHNGVECNTNKSINSSSETGCSNVIKIASISTLIEQKGLFFLLDAVRQIKERCDKDFVLYLVGDGPLKERIQYHISKYKLNDKIIFTGWIKDAYLHVLPNVDIFVQPSLWEAMSMVVLEAMSAGKAIVATRVGDNDKVLRHLETAVLIDSADSKQIADALIMLIENSDLRRTLAKNALKEFQADFTVNHMCAKYEKIFSILSKKKNYSITN